MLSRSKKARPITDEVIGIIDIGSARVSGALMTAWPKLKGEISEALEWQDKPDFKRFQLGVETALRKVLAKMSHSGSGRPEELYIFLSSPFFIGNTSLINARSRHQIEVDPPYLANLIRENIADLASEDLVKLESEVMKIKLDGYETERPIGETAQEVQLAYWQSVGHIELLERLRDIIWKVLPHIKIHFHSFAYATYAVFSELLPDKDWVLLDTGNELTDILVIKNGYLAEHLSFPLGKNFLIREVAQQLQTVPAETLSALDRHAAGHGNNILNARLEPILAKVSQKWFTSLEEALGQVLQTTILPETIYLFGDEPSDKLFADWLKEADFSDLSPSRHPPKIVYAEKPLIQAVHRLESLSAGKTSKLSPPLKNSFLLVEALFCATIRNSKLEVWPFNQLVNNMKDIINTKKSLRDIFPSRGGDEVESEEISFKTSGYQPVPSRVPSGSGGMMVKIFIAMIALAIVVGGGFALSTQFAKVTVKVTPRQGRLMVSNTYEATKDGASGLKFVLASNIQAIDEVSVPAGGSETVKTKAQGQIVVYNNYSTKSQNLIATTRFETPGGLVYRTPKAVVVPGQTKNSKGELIPGQLEVAVLADQPGPGYNLKNADFKLPGFKGTAKYNKIYARTKTELAGGAVGTQPQVAEVDLTKAKTDLEKQLKLKVVAKLKPQVPDDYVLFDDAIVINFSSQLINDSNKPDQAELKMTADATGVLLNKNELASYLAKQQVPDYKDEPVEISNWSDLKFSLVDTDALNLATLDKINFKLNGTGNLAWSFDQKDLKEKLQTAGVSNYKSLFSKDFPQVQTASLIFSPPWVRSIPSDNSKIKIETDLSQP